MTEPTPGAGPAPRIDTSVAHSARVWNHLLGGKDNYPADREAGELIVRMFPDIARLARLQRYFLARAVRFLAGEAGIRQFLDVGTGLPTADNTHEVAQRVAPESRIVYVDNDPLVLVHAQALLTSVPPGVTDYIEEDVRHPDRIIEGAAHTLNFDEPVALMMLGITGQVSDEDDPWAIVRRLMDALPSGSYLALSDGTDTSDSLNQAIAVYNANSASSYHLRAPERIAAYFEGLELVEPGVVTTTTWRPDVIEIGDGSRQVDAICGVGRKP
ncbi:SAM-dependent methyltransferase [Sphaerisporangium sp. TRM90804]|uniref:SAM-dependent methyltransferase n=1 Tax=Sphaerisporangium sp. TRM90804 TaxID=3031113 RepID=UPI00244C809A|nr:SAM-dependent methyltransferase [Sphaerisporangium sp. TRM90804]MDH2427247.1 SAM-dependent methyltransferase [Sphaerisporangium sp. TRM90804]